MKREQGSDRSQSNVVFPLRGQASSLEPTQPEPVVTSSYGPVCLQDNARLHQGDVINEGDNIYMGNDEAEDFRAFRDSLAFDDIHLREENIKPAHKDTFGWIFERPSHSVHSRSASQEFASRPISARKFQEWVERQGLCRPFWIRGKAGSGKSTLMNLVSGHEKAASLLANWQPGVSQLVISKHFFWELGSPLQRRLQGFMRSVLWRFFTDCEMGLDIWKEKWKKSGARSWSRENLDNALSDLMTRPNIAWCFFVDGLDECEDVEDFFKILDTLCALPHVKVCVSSRPEVKFEHKFKDCPTLRLDQLTFDDMHRYAWSELLDAYRSVDKHDSASEVQKLVDVLLSKAQGVFVWLCVAVRILKEGIQNLDDWPTLTRLEELPEEIHELYKHMMRRGQRNLKKYEASAGEIFKVLLCHEKVDRRSSMSLAQLAWIIHKEKRREFLQSRLTLKQAQEAAAPIDLEALRIWVPARCACFVEVVNSIQASKHLQYFSGSWRMGNFPACILSDTIATKITVQFLHKTVGEFLTDTAEGKELTLGCEASTADVQCAIAEADVVLFLSAALLVGSLESNELSHFVKDMGSATDHLYQWRVLGHVMEAYQWPLASNEWYHKWLWHGERLTHPLRGNEGFLYWTLWEGHYDYVLEAVSSAEQRPSPRVLSDLIFLIAAMIARGQGSFKMWYVRALVSSGADPNAVICNTVSTPYEVVGSKFSLMQYCSYLLAFDCAFENARSNLYGFASTIADLGGRPEANTTPALQEIMWDPRLQHLPSVSKWMITFPWLDQEQVDSAGIKWEVLVEPRHTFTQNLRPLLSCDYQYWFAFNDVADLPQLIELLKAYHQTRLREEVARVPRRYPTIWSLPDDFITALGSDFEHLVTRRCTQLPSFRAALEYLGWSNDEIEMTLRSPELRHWHAL